MKKIVLTFFSLLTAIGCLQAQQRFWTDVPESSISTFNASRKIIPNVYRTFSLDMNGTNAYLLTAPKEFSVDAGSRQTVLVLPLPEGGSERFSVVETEIMEHGLQAMFPSIKAYTGKGLDDATATIKIDVGPRGFHAAILSQKGSRYIDPYAQGLLTSYISYYKKDLAPHNNFTEELDPEAKISLLNPPDGQRIEAFTGCIADTLLRYRLAVACTGEYAVAVGATTVAQALSAIVTSINRVNGVYETELAVRLVLVDSNYKLVYIDPATDFFTQNNNGSGLLTESIKICDSLIGTANYDVGHTFSTGGGGVAGLGVVCRTTKARGVTGLTNPTGDAYDIDYVAHEMGHQFGGGHTFNSATGSCGGGNRSAGTAAEPGSGSSIMAYAGICTVANDLQPHSDPYFHPVSYMQITNYVHRSTGFGNTCPIRIVTGNSAPTVNAGADYIIPKSTPFVMTGLASDPNNEPLTYAWDQVDVNGPAGNWNVPAGNAPLFRLFPPKTIPTRYFPQLSDVVRNTTTIGEILPSYGRNINLRLTARDNRAGGGGICYDDALVTVNANAGPFIVTAPNVAETDTVGHFMRITWDVANTNTAPILCDSVVIELSTDSGYTFPITLLSRTPNDGVEDIIVPNNPTTAARIRVRALRNVFYDISNTNFTIVNTNIPEFVLNNPPTVVGCTVAGLTTLVRTASVNSFTTPITFTATGNPAGTGVAFSGNPITPGSSVDVSLLGTVAPGTYSIIVTGTAGSITRSRTIVFSFGTPTITPVQTTPANNSTGNTLTPTFTWQAAAGATFYTLLVSTSNAFADTVISATGLSSTSYPVPVGRLQTNTQYFWRVAAANNCGAGSPSGAYNFRTGYIVCSDTLRSVNVPITIPATVATVTSTLAIANGGVIADVDVVGLKGTHTYVSDLTVSLTSPANSTVRLFSGVCGSMANFDINFDDEAPAGAIVCPPTGGQVKRPLEVLSKFDNETSTGTWTLTVADGYAQDGGSLTAWGLRICTYSANPALPVNWLSFTATKNTDATITAKWLTASEINNHHYELERSADGRNFVSIGSIAAGRNAGTQTYLFTDMKPYNGMNYYRVKQIDNDGKISYSAVAVVRMDKAAAWSVYPNPAKGKTTLYAQSNLTDVQVQVTDVLGKLLYNGYIPSLKAGQSLNIPLNNLAKGMYLLKVYSEKQTTTEKIMVE